MMFLNFNAIVRSKGLLLVVLLSMVRCSSLEKTSNDSAGIKSVKRATVQKTYPGVEGAKINFKLAFELELSTNKVQLDSVLYNGRFVAINALTNKNEFKAAVRFSSEELKSFADDEFIINSATVYFTLPNQVVGQKVISDLTVLEPEYMP